MDNQISEETAESIGRPLIESVLEAHKNSDYDLLIELVPGMKGKLEKEEFSEAVDRLNGLGELQSIDYLGLIKKVKENLILWRVRYSQSEEDILWHLYLSKSDKKPKIIGLFFDF